MRQAKKPGQDKTFQAHHNMFLVVASGHTQNEINLESIKNHSVFINCTNIENLPSTTMTLLNFKPKKILMEKPGSISLDKLNQIQMINKTKNCNLFIA